MPFGRISADSAAGALAPGFRPMMSRDVLQMAVVLADRAAEHRVGLAALHHQRGDHRVARAHEVARIIGRDALALHQRVIERSSIR